MNRNIGKKLKKIRLQLGLSQKEMSEKINLSQATYNRFERGDSKTWVHYLEAICIALGVTEEELLNSGDATTHSIEDIKQDHQSKELENTLLLYDMLIMEKDKRIAVLEEMVHILHGKKS